MKLLKGIGFYVLLIFSLIFSSFGVAIAISLIQDALFVPQDYLLFTYDSPTKYLIFVIIFGVDIIVYGLLSSKAKWNKGTFYELFPGKLKRHKAAILLSFAVILYLTVPNVTIFTNNTIRHYSFYNLSGKEYAYKDIVSVDTGVYGKKIPFIRDKGQFYYIVKFVDGTRVDIMDIGDENSDDTYLQIENIDRKVMDQGAQKKSSLANIDLLKLGKVYVDRFRRIIQNK